MNRPSAKNFSARIFFAAVALVLFLQTAAPALAQDRWLLVFENSAAMKKRMPAVGLELQKLFAFSMNGQLHGGDSLGVWTFDQTLHVGEFPLSMWEPELAANTASNLVVFLNKRSFKGEVNFNVLQPVLNEVVAGSQRLTVLIFCEGQGEVIWTPYNDGINRTLVQNYAERKKSGQPFVIVLRVQDGKYFGCSVNFPPGGLNFPAFPPPPEEIKPPVAAVTNVVAEPEKKHAPLDSTPLVIVGTNVGTNVADLPPLPPKPETNLPPVAAPAALTNNAAANNASATASNLPAPVVALTAPAATNVTAGIMAPPAAAPSSPPKPATDNGYQFLIWTGVLALISAVALVIFLIARARQPRGSLITDSLNAPRMPPRKE